MQHYGNFIHSGFISLCICLFGFAMNSIIQSAYVICFDHFHAKKKVAQYRCCLSPAVRTFLRFSILMLYCGSATTPCMHFTTISTVEEPGFSIYLENIQKNGYNPSPFQYALPNISRG